MENTARVRSSGVTVNAVLILISSSLLIVMGLLGAVGLATAPTQLGVPKALVAVLVVVTYAVPGGLGITGAVGVMGLRNWARILLVVESIFFGICSGLMALVLAVMPVPPAPPNASPAVLKGVMLGLAAMGGATACLGGFWAWFFCRRSVRRQFGPAGAVMAPGAHQGLPLNRLLIGIYLGVGGLGSAVAAWLGSPANLGVWIYAGPSARLICGLFCAAFLGAGAGLLLRRTWGQYTAIGFIAFNLISTASGLLAPGWAGRARAIMAGMPLRNPTLPPVFMERTMNLVRFPSLAVVLGLYGAMLYFLVTRPDRPQPQTAVAAEA